MPELTPTRRAVVALQTVRAAAALTAVGAVTSPPLGVTGSAVMLLAFAFVPDARARLARVLREPLGLGWLILVGALLVAALASAVQASPAVAVSGLNDWRHLLLIPVALAAFDTRDSRMRFALVLIGIALAGALASLIATAVGFSRNEQFPGIVLRNPVTQALAITIGALLSGVLAATQTQMARHWRIVLAASSALLVAQLVLLQTGRSGFVALVVAGAVATLLLLRGRTRWVALIGLPLLAAGIVAASPNLSQRFGLALDEMRNAAHATEYSSMGMRMVIWRGSVEVVAARPLLGHGLGGFAAAYAERLPSRYAEGWRAQPQHDPHNQFLFVWAEAGLLGLAGFLALLVAALRQPAESPYRAIGLALLAAWCVNSLFSSHFQTFNEGHLIVLFLGVFLARTPQPWPQRPPAVA